jgi:hypothetical protein
LVVLGRRDLANGSAKDNLVIAAKCIREAAFYEAFRIERPIRLKALKTVEGQLGWSSVEMSRAIDRDAKHLLVTLD